jgi:hypothetical protein
MWNFFLQQIIPGIYADYANIKFIEPSYEKASLKVVVLAADYFSKKDTLEQLKKDFEKQQERKKAIEDKAKTIFATIGIAITAMTFTLNYTNINFHYPGEIISTIAIIISVVYLVMSGIRAMQTINIRKFNTFQTEIIESENEITILPIATEEEQLKVLSKAKLLNDKIIIKLSNLAYSSAILLRNGIILFAIYFIIAVIQKVGLIKSTNIEKNMIKIELPKTPKIYISMSLDSTQLTLLKLIHKINRYNPLLDGN